MVKCKKSDGFDYPNLKIFTYIILSTSQTKHCNHRFPQNCSVLLLDAQASES